MDIKRTDDKKTLYVFIDESGNFDFSLVGTKFFVLTSITISRPFKTHITLDTLKHDLIDSGLDTEYFHASDNNVYIRNKVYESICGENFNYKIDSIIVEKRKAYPGLQRQETLYSRIFGCLITYIFNGIFLQDYKEIIIIADAVSKTHRKKAIEKAVKGTLSNSLPADTKFRLIFHSSKSSFNLQIADYCSYAIFRKWENRDLKFYDKVKSKIKSEFDIFRSGNRYYF